MRRKKCRMCRPAPFSHHLKCLPLLEPGSPTAFSYLQPSFVHAPRSPKGTSNRSSTRIGFRGQACRREIRTNEATECGIQSRHDGMVKSDLLETSAPRTPSSFEFHKEQMCHCGTSRSRFMTSPCPFPRPPAIRQVEPFLPVRILSGSYFTILVKNF